MKISLGTEEDIKITKKIGEEFFGTKLDPEQLNPESVSTKSLLKKKGSLVVVKENKSIIGFFFAWPTTKSLMNKFVKKEINEQQLFDLSEKESIYDSIYLCASIIQPEYRNKGIATKLAIYAINKLSGKKKMNLFCWIFSKEGDLFVNSLSKKLGIKITKRSN